MNNVHLPRHAPAEDAEYQVEWHGRVVKGKVYMRDLANVASKQTNLPPINSAMTDRTSPSL